MKIKSRLNRKKIFAGFLLIMSFIMGINFFACVIIGYHFKGSAYFKGKVTPEGIYMLHSCGKYTVVPKEVFINYRRLEVITFLFPGVLVLILLTYKSIYRESFKEINENVVKLTDDIRLIRKLKKINTDKFGCYCVIIVFICIFIYIFVNIFYKSQPKEITSKKKHNELSNKSQNEIIDQGHEDQSDFFPPIEDSGNNKQKSP